MLLCLYSEKMTDLKMMEEELAQLRKSDEREKNSKVQLYNCSFYMHCISL